MQDLIDSFSFLADIVETEDAQNASVRDPADQQVLAILRASGADYLITGDKDLLALAKDYPILTPAAFWTRHG